MYLRYQVLMLCLCYWALVMSQSRTQSRSQSCDRSRFDRHSANAWSMFGLTEHRWPESSAQLTQYCSKAGNDTDFTKQYANNCLNGTSRTLMTSLANNFERVNQAFCMPNGPLRNQFVSWGQCGNQAKSGTAQCYTELATILANVPRVRESQYRLPVICCIYYHWKWCNDNAIGQVSQCRGQARTGFGQYVSNATVDTMALICNQYEDSHNACVPYMDKFVRTRPQGRLAKNLLLYVVDYYGNR